jgi:hypothetical protein
MQTSWQRLWLCGAWHIVFLALGTLFSWRLKLIDEFFFGNWSHSRITLAIFSTNSRKHGK